jgi:hypothetical protein
MKYKELEELRQGTRKLLDFFENDPKAIQLPSLSISSYTYVTEYHKDENGWRDYNNPDEFNTRLKMRKLAKALGSARKDYYGDTFQLVKEFGPIRLIFQAKRQAVCRKVVTETIEHEAEFVPAHTKDAWTEEKVEWVCDDPLLAEQS